MTLLLNFLNFLVHLIEFKLKVPLIAQCRVHDFITIWLEDFHLWCLLNQLQRLAASTGGVAQHLNVQRPRTCIYHGLTLTAVFCITGGWGVGEYTAMFESLLGVVGTIFDNRPILGTPMVRCVFGRSSVSNQSQAR